MSRFFSARIRENLPVDPHHNLLSLDVPSGLPQVRPGQFFLVEVSKGTDPLLRRAFSLFRLVPSGIELLFRVHGKGTELLRSMKEGTQIEVIGPLGNGYPVPAQEAVPLVVAGGIGIASVFSLVQSIEGRARVFYGARCSGGLLMKEEVRALSAELLLSTDDGSEGERGTTADALRAYLARGVKGTPLIFACGPRPMLSSVAKVAAEFKVKAHVSLEEHMACGIGACLGCVVKVRCAGMDDADLLYRRVCKEGPVFDSAEVAWD